MNHGKREVLRSARDHGVTITEEPDIGRIFADAPDGKVFTASDTHTLVADWGDVYGLKTDAWQDLGERLNYGVEACYLDDCDVCKGES